jgi:hypothetical protein
MVTDVRASPEGDSPGDPGASGPDGPVLCVGDPVVCGVGVAGGVVDVHADSTRSNAIIGNAGARGDPICARYQARS